MIAFLRKVIIIAGCKSHEFEPRSVMFLSILALYRHAKVIRNVTSVINMKLTCIELTESQLTSKA